MNFQDGYLRVLKPRTINGLTPQLDDQHQVIFKESHHPLAARKELERINATLLNGLKLIIEEVRPYQQQAKPRPNPVPNSAAKVQEAPKLVPVEVKTIEDDIFQ